MLKVVNAMGDACPIPVVKTKNAIKELSGAGMVETLVDNEIAVQNLTKMAQQKNYGVRSEKLGENQYRVIMTIGESADEAGVEADEEVRTEEVVDDTEDNSGTMKDWDYTYSGDSKATSETDNEVEVQSSNDTTVLAGYLLHIRSKVGMGELNILNKIYANFKVESKHRTDVEDTLVTSTIQVDINWTITVSDNTGLKPNPGLKPDPGLKPIQ